MIETKLFGTNEVLTEAWLLLVENFSERYANASFTRPNRFKKCRSDTNICFFSFLIDINLDSNRW